MTHKPLASLAARFSIALLCAASAAGGVGAQAPSPSRPAHTQVRPAQTQLRLTPAQLRPKTQELYPTKPMNDSRKGEDTRIVDHGLLIHYMSNEERENARVVIVNGRLYTSRGEPTPYGKAGEDLNYVMDAAGNFYIFNQTGHPELRHSSFFDGRPVAGAGDLVVKDGTIAKIDHNSGHYSPSDTMFQNVLSELKKDGVDLSH
jgi:hypothetical protein